MIWEAIAVVGLCFIVLLVLVWWSYYCGKHEGDAAIEYWRKSWNEARLNALGCGMSAYDWRHLEEWVRGKCPKTPETAFTSSVKRDLARIVAPLQKENEILRKRNQLLAEDNALLSQEAYAAHMQSSPAVAAGQVCKDLSIKNSSVCMGKRAKNN